MRKAELPVNETRRLRALRSYEVLDTVAERGFDDLVALAAEVFDVPIALVSLVDEDRQWFKAKIGIDACQSGRDEAFCSHAILDPGVMIVPDAAEDERFHDNPFVTNPPHIRFYAGAPILDPGGNALGTLCLIDDKPGTFTAAQAGVLARMASQAMDQIRLRKASRDAAEYQQRLTRHRDELEAEVARRTAQVVKTREEVVHCLARAAEFRDDDTGHHIRRVSLYSQTIAEALGLNQTCRETIGLAATLHDIGKIGVPDAILLKPGKLTDEEFALIQGHAAAGAEIVQMLADDEKLQLKAHCDHGAAIVGEAEFELMAVAARIARSHHERFDGTGYPRGLAGEAIPLEGRIVAVADVFDALSNRRTYKPAYPLRQCYDILEDGRGGHFDPAVLDAFFDRRAEIEAIHQCWAEPGDAGRDAAA
ncbi:MAG: HD domain-containing phosphohydrolase [Planctomycetota bacterium]